MQVNFEKLKWIFQLRVKTRCGMNFRVGDHTTAIYLDSVLSYLKFPEEGEESFIIDYDKIIPIIEICKQQIKQVCLKCVFKYHESNDNCCFQKDITPYLTDTQLMAWNKRNQPKLLQAKSDNVVPYSNKNVTCVYGMKCLNFQNGMCNLVHKPKCAYGAKCMNYLEGGSSYCHLEH